MCIPKDRCASAIVAGMQRRGREKLGTGWVRAEQDRAMTRSCNIRQCDKACMALCAASVLMEIFYFVRYSWEVE